jgi:FkbM family methyltransferase
MRQLIQTACLKAYRAVLATGLFETEFGKRLFIAVYGIYKQRFEAGAVETLRSWVVPGTLVVDVGANVGFFTTRLAQWTGPAGRVIAIEPEAANLRLLRRQLETTKVAAMVEVIEGVAAEKSGTLHLALSPYNPADHRIGDNGVPVRAWTVDELMAARQWPIVSLVKIDVQGAEVRVLRGARETIRRFHPVLFIEIDEGALSGAGFTADTLFDEIEGQGYHLYDPNEPSTPLTRSEAAMRRRALGYADYLCRARPQAVEQRPS